MHTLHAWKLSATSYLMLIGHGVFVTLSKLSSWITLVTSFVADEAFPSKQVKQI